MTNKTHWTAVAVVPPEGVWSPVQAIRKRHDRKFSRWMPHLNLLYPFRPAEQFGEAARRLTEVSSAIAPFPLALADFRSFTHGPESFTIWLAPESPEPVRLLQAALQAEFPDCDEVSRFPSGFTPHLSVGQAPSEQALARLLAALRSDWKPIRFEVSEIALVRREAEGPFRIERTIALGRSAG